MCRRYGLIRTPELLSAAAEIMQQPRRPTAPCQCLLVLTLTAVFAFVVADGADQPVLIDLPNLNRREVAAHLSYPDGWLGVYDERFRTDRGAKLPPRRVMQRWHRADNSDVRVAVGGTSLAPIHTRICGTARR